MKRCLKETLFVMLATWAIDGAVDHWTFGHQHSAYISPLWSPRLRSAEATHNAI
jgi:hypothetical protein